MSQEELYENLIQDLKRGGLPCTTGMILTDEQAKEVESLLMERKKQIDDYLELAVKTRVLKTRNVI